MGKNIVLIRFSPRDLGNCAGIAQYLTNYHSKDFIQDFKIVNNILIPCGDCDYECLKPDTQCPNVTVSHIQIMDAVCQAN